MRRTMQKQKPATLKPEIPWNPDGLVLALQFWRGDAEQAFRLARLIADIEPIRRNDCALYLCCDANTEQTDEMLGTLRYCENKMPVGTFQSMRAGTGHPDGPNVLWAATLQFFFQQWNRGALNLENVFTFEADGAPLRLDWISRLIDAHRETIRQRLLITASVRFRHFMRHPNGNLIAHVSAIRNYPELTETPPALPWDMHHHTTLCRIARHDTVIRSEHRSLNWSGEPLTSIATETAWLHGCRDDSVYNFSRAMIPKPTGAASETKAAHGRKVVQASRAPVTANKHPAHKVAISKKGKPHAR